jgi:hypothetical protein
MARPDSWLPTGHHAVLAPGDRYANSALHFLVSLLLDGTEGGGAEQKFSKVHGSRLGWSSGSLPVNCSQIFINVSPASADPEVFIVGSPLSQSVLPQLFLVALYVRKSNSAICD